MTPPTTTMARSLLPALFLAGAVAVACGAPRPAAEPQAVVVPEAPSSSAKIAWKPMSASSSRRPPSTWRARLEPCTPGALSTPLAREQFKNAVIVFNQGDYAQALETFAQLYLQTCTTPVLYNVATTLERTGDTQAAIEVFELFIEREPDSRRAEEARQRIETLRGSR